MAAVGGHKYPVFHRGDTVKHTTIVWNNFNLLCTECTFWRSILLKNHREEFMTWEHKYTLTCHVALVSTYSTGCKVHSHSSLQLFCRSHFFSARSVQFTTLMVEPVVTHSSSQNFRSKAISEQCPQTCPHHLLCSGNTPHSHSWIAFQIFLIIYACAHTETNKLTYS